MLPSHGESTVENTLSEKVSEVSTQISDSDMPKNMEDQIIYTAEPIESDIQASLLRQQKSVMKQLEQKRMPVAIFLIVLLSEV
jgi:TolA-binding protein